ncbi:hypothetical protein QCA50_000507 [Cerrena zonata]|uniref:Uncharacterized protein n=1 Tax=Cerrena zonata TaxID=2478898 RepID=A0AAW0GWV4_9APHY
MQFGVQRMNYRKDLERIETIRQQARSAAWGTKLTPTEGQRKVKVNLGGPSRMDEDGNIISGRWIDMVVEGNDIFILESDGSMTVVDESTATRPSMKGTWFLALVGNIVSKLGKRDSTGTSAEEAEIDENEDSSSDMGGSGTVTPSDGSGAGKKAVKAAATTMAGGRRRKNVKKR